MEIIVSKSKYSYMLTVTDAIDNFIAMVHEELFDDNPDIMRRLKAGEEIVFTLTEKA